MSGNASLTKFKSADEALKAYVNIDHPAVILRFEDGHQIIVSQGKVKTFDAYTGEVIRIVAEYDPTSRRLLGNFPQAFSHVAMVSSACNLERAESKKPAAQRASA